MSKSSSNEKKSYAEWEKSHSKEQLDKLYKAVEEKIKAAPSTDVDINALIEEVLSEGDYIDQT